MTDLAPRTQYLLLHRTARAQSEGRLPSLAVGVVRRGSLAWSAGRGRLPDGSTPDADTQYRIGSLTKTFTAVLVLRLRDEGRLDLSDPLDRHLPGTPLGDRTIRQLLSHGAGVQAETDGPWWERTPGGDWAQLARTLHPGAAPLPAGQRFHYSNLGYSALGEVVARLRGRSWADCLVDEVLVPLGMGRTTFRPEPPAAPGLAVHPWADLVLPEPEFDAGAMAPAGQLWSTLTDLAAWVGFLSGTGPAGGQAVLSADSLQEMRAPVTVETRPTGWAGYGLGLQVWPVEGGAHVGHGGSMPGFLAGLRLDPQTGDAALVLANATAGLDPALPGDLLEILADEEPVLPEDWTPHPVAAGVIDLLGPWYWGPSAFAVKALADGLIAIVPLGPQGGRASRFRPQPDGSWVGLDGYYAGEKLRVVRRPDGAISHLDLASFIFTREPYDPEAEVPGGVDPEGWRA